MANDVPRAAGQNELHAVATVIDGIAARHAVTVSSDGAAPVRVLTVDRARGMAPPWATFRLETQT